MFSKIGTFYLKGLKGVQIDVETDISRGIPDFRVIGLCSSGIHESAKRVRTAIINSGFSFPKGRVTVNLAPADIRKDGSGFDLPIAIGILTACGLIPGDNVRDISFVGELSLDGSIKPIRGILPMVIQMSSHGIKKFVIPKRNLSELYGTGFAAAGAESLREAVDIILKNGSSNVFEMSEEFIYSNIGENGDTHPQYDFSDVFGQSDVKRAIEIAVSGRHNILFMGCRGSGKTMLAKCIPGIMPKMSREEILESASIYSAAGLLMRNDNKISSDRPFREIQPGITQTSLVGGRENGIGEINLAHNGVLYIDEITEMKPNLIDSLRMPLENCFSLYSKYGTIEKISADFLLVATANPCRCGNLFEGADKCSCSRAQIKNRLSKISLPIADRIDIHIPVRSVKYSDYNKKGAESSLEVRERIKRTTEIQSERYKNETVKLNGRLDRRLTERYCRPCVAARGLLETAVNEMGFSVRGCEKVLRIARTIADMDCREEISKYDISEALQYRMLDRKEFLGYGNF